MEMSREDWDRFEAFNEKHQVGIGRGNYRRAFEIAHQRLGGDLELGMLWIYASGLAIAVGHRLPTHAERTEARAQWNDNHARGMMERLLEREREK